MSQAVVERLFPKLDDLIELHMNFLRNLQDLQKRNPDRSVEKIGDTLVNQVKGDLSRITLPTCIWCSYGQVSYTVSFHIIKISSFKIFMIEIYQGIGFIVISWFVSKTIIWFICYCSFLENQQREWNVRTEHSAADTRSPCLITRTYWSKTGNSTTLSR